MSGASRERKVRAELESVGFVVKGSGDAHGLIDLIALRRGFVLLVQVKGTSGGPWERFGPAARADFIDECARAGFDGALAWAPPDRKPTRWYVVRAAAVGSARRFSTPDLDWRGPLQLDAVVESRVVPQLRGH